MSDFKGEERREHARKQIEGARVTCNLDDKGNVGIRLVDISIGGACVLMSGAPHIGARLTLALDFPDRDAKIDAVACVVWAKPVTTEKENGYLTGLRFEGLTEGGAKLEDILGLRGTRIRRPDADDDRRKFVRMPVDAEEVICVPKGLHKALNLSSESTAILIDLSQGGARLKTRSPLDIGQQVHVRLRIPKVGDILEVDGIVMWLEEKSDSEGQPACYVGVQFAEVPAKARTVLQSLEEWYTERTKSEASQ